MKTRLGPAIASTQYNLTLRHGCSYPLQACLLSTDFGSSVRTYSARCEMKMVRTLRKTFGNCPLPNSDFQPLSLHFLLLSSHILALASHFLSSHYLFVTSDFPLIANQFLLLTSFPPPTYHFLLLNSHLITS